jgi:hypothetical protein
MVRHDSAQAVSKDALSDRLRDSQLGIVPERLSGSWRDRYAANPEVAEEPISRSKIVEQDDATPGGHERRKAIDIERSLWMHKYQRIVRAHVVEVDTRRDYESIVHLRASDLDKISVAFPVSSVGIERLGPAVAGEKERRDDPCQRPQSRGRSLHGREVSPERRT